VLDESYSPSTTDFGPIINKVISAKADALLGGGHYPDGSTLARQLHDQKVGLKWVTLLVAPDTPKFAELVFQSSRPARGATQTRLAIRVYTKCFNPRAPRGARQTP